MAQEIDYYAALGISEKTQDAAEPATPGAADKGAKEQGAAAPAGAGTSAAGDKGQATTAPEAKADAAATAEKTTTTEEGKQQTPEEREKYAAARRKAETEKDLAIAETKASTDQKIQEAREAARKEAQDELIKEMGLTNPYSKKPVTNLAEYLEYKSQHAKFEAEREFKKTGVNPDQIKKLVDEHPAVKQAAEAVQKLNEASERASEAAGRAKIDEGIRTIQTDLDPGIKSLDDIKALGRNADGTDNGMYGKFYEQVVKNHLSIADAYKLVFFDRIQAQKSAAAKQATLNAANGKNHLQSMTQSGTGSAEIPPETLKLYQSVMPGKTFAEYQQHYTKYKKG